MPAEVTKNLKDGQNGFIAHVLEINGKKNKRQSVYYPLSLLKQSFGIIFSMDGALLYNNLTKYMLFAAFFTLLVVSFAFLFILFLIHKRNLKENFLNNKVHEVLQLFENLPIGVVALNSDRKIKTINKIARDMLFIKHEDDVTGVNISDRFLASKSYFSTGDGESAFDSNQFILYQQEGNEVVVYKKDTAFIVNGEDIFLEAFIDVTSIEKSRKYEAAANTAKSEFLAKMSHEIRTPMNGIIGMTDAIEQDNLNDAQKEYIQIVKKSADLLLSIIDDILDFSKIESGKMQLEEIPFRLNEELKLSLDLFKPIIEEKNIQLITTIDENVPNNIIGDPFRLRQVLSNLISNAVKFTHEGKILVCVSLDESYDGNYTLRFSVEDTGVGIPKTKLESIFNSFTQADESTSRKYGGSGLGTTIAKQLVNLMHGEIWVDSPVNSGNTKYPGTRFTFTIEVYSNEPLKKEMNTEDFTKAEQLSSLIISKNDEAKKRLIHFLDLYKINHKTYNYQDDKLDNLINLLKENYQEFNLLILLDEPNFGCIEVAKKMRESNVMDKFIAVMLSSNHKPDNYTLTKRAGIDYYFTQPFEQDEFIYAIYERFPNIERIAPEEKSSLRPDLKILVAEDNIINQKVAETIFRNIGYEIDLAADGKIAVEMVQKKQYDIVFYGFTHA
ncbi:MAG: hypothetical protein HC906_06605 [Bacteroidales bacterium]|nr:hypothetical protein [Bacteroidales bacterium]